jgi:hypothetical protein
MYALSATVSAYFFAMWKRADPDLRSRVWRRYGWFSALAFVGSCAGLVTAVGDNQYRYIFHRVVAFFNQKNGYTENTCDQIKLNDYQDPIEWFKAILACYQGSFSDVSLWMNRLSVSPVPYAIEFLCICCANLLVRLHSPPPARRCPPFVAHPPHNADQVVERMVDFVGKGQQLGGRWLKLSARVAIVSVTVLNASNLAFMAVQSYFCVQGLFFFYVLRQRGKRAD